jgi:hypothetical protein
MRSRARRTGKATYRNLRTSETRTSVQSNTVTTCTTVDLDLTGIRLEVGCGIFCGDTTLNRETSSSNVFLSQAQRCQSSASGDLDLRGNDIDTSDFLCRSGREMYWLGSHVQSESIND